MFRFLKFLNNKLFIKGILIEENSFTNNKGCFSTFGNVVIACDPSSYAGKDYSLSTKPNVNYTRVKYKLNIIIIFSFI